MTQRLVGQPQEVEAFLGHMGRLYEAGFAVAGSVGLIAMEAAAGIDGPPLAVHWDHPEVPGWPQYRDTDIITPRGDADRPAIEALQAQTRHVVDDGLNNYFDIAGSALHHPSFRGRVNLDVDPRALAFHTRLLDGVPVYTLPYGTAEAMIPWTDQSIDPEKYADAGRRISVLSLAMREQHPEEFLTAEHYEPFRQFAQREQ